MHNQTDKEAIVHHIDGLFGAFLRRDREAIRRGHTKDWRGFQVASRSLVRGIDAYMAAADQALASMRGTRYEMLDCDVETHGDLALVHYLARYWIAVPTGGERSVLLRAVDVYRREPEGWNQCASNICAIPDERASPRDLSEAERGELLAAREELWRAWFANDRARLSAILPEETIAMDPGVDAWRDRRAVLDASDDFAKSGATLVSLRFDRTEIQLYGDVAVLYTTYAFETESDGRRDARAGRGTEVFVRRMGRWQNAGWCLH
jgi:ketosteroid isomerase-like protein